MSAGSQPALISRVRRIAAELKESGAENVELTLIRLEALADDIGQGFYDAAPVVGIVEACASGWDSPQ